jgi:hypothetical protein
MAASQKAHENATFQLWLYLAGPKQKYQPLAEPTQT